jgi:hypothetical protein
VITRTVGNHVKDAGDAGCDLKTLHPLVKRYGAQLVGGVLNDACANGSLRYVKGRLWPPKSKSKAEKEPEDKNEKPEPAKVKKSIPRLVVLGEPLEKAGPFIGPRGGKWADPKHTIPWHEGVPHQGLKEQAHGAVKDAVIEAAHRAVGAGANPKDMKYLGAGAEGILFESGGKAFKVARFPEGRLAGRLENEAEVLRSLEGTPAAKLIPKVYKYDKKNQVIVREMVEGRPGGWAAGKKAREAYDIIVAELAKKDWGHPEFKEDSFIFDEKGENPKMVDVGFVTPRGKREAKWVEEIIMGAKTKEDIDLLDVGFSLRASLSEGHTSPETGRKLRAKIAEVHGTKGTDIKSYLRELDSMIKQAEGELKKAAPHKYIRRVPKPGGGYRYFYRETAVAREAVAGEEIRLGKRVATVVNVATDGTITLELDGKRQTVSPDQWHTLLTKHYGEAFVSSAQKRAQQTINAIMRHVPRALLEDLKGDTDEARLADLAKRVPAVYAKLEKAFSRAGMSPVAAKRSLGLVLERRGWEPEARALAIGTVIRYRQIGTRDLIRASENLAGGGKVGSGHVAAAVELRAPGGKPDRFTASTTELAKSAESELALLAKRLSETKVDDETSAREASAAVLAQVLNSESMQKLLLMAQAFPGMADKAIEPVRNAILGAGSVAARKQPTTDGSETVVYVAGEGGKPKALEAQYKLVEADSLIASHDPESFSRRKDYPEGVQERAYHRDKAEQAKVIRNAQKMEPRFVANTNPDAVNGPPMVLADGTVLGGNSRTMSMQRIYKQHPERADEMRKYLEDHAHEVGLTADDIKAMKNPILIREVKAEDKSKAGLQLLVRQMNESFTQGMDPRTMQVAMGRKLTDQTLATLADSMTEDETLSAFLSSPRSERFVASLFQAGIIDNRNVNQYMVKGTRRLNNDGKTLVSRILVGRTVDNADVLSDTGVQMMDSIAGSVPSMVKAASHGKGYDLGDDLGVAVDAFNDLQRRVDQGHLPALDPKMSEGALNRLYNYFNVLPGIGEPHPVIHNERAQALLEVLIRKRGPVQMAKVFREYAKIAAANPEGQAAMFGAKTSPMDALKQAAGIGGKEPQLKLMASMPSERFVLRRVS